MGCGTVSGGCFKQLKELLRNKLVHHENRHYDGYRLTYLGYARRVSRARRRHTLSCGRGSAGAQSKPDFECVRARSPSMRWETISCRKGCSLPLSLTSKP